MKLFYENIEGMYYCVSDFIIMLYIAFNLDLSRPFN